jgi:hypothetical protein
MYRSSELMSEYPWKNPEETDGWVVGLNVVGVSKNASH